MATVQVKECIYIILWILYFHEDKQILFSFRNNMNSIAPPSRNWLNTYWIAALSNNVFSSFFKQECPTGTFGLNCSATCPSNYHGVFCKEECHCTDGQYCDSIHGCIQNASTLKLSDWFYLVNLFKKVFKCHYLRQCYW